MVIEPKYVGAGSFREGLSFVIDQIDSMNLYYYFINKKDSKIKNNNLIAWYLILIIKNLVGYSLILGGIVMLVLPGQGLFTIIIGLMLSNYPGKYSIEKKFITIPSVLKSINWLRKKSNKPPLKLI